MESIFVGFGVGTVAGVVWTQLRKFLLKKGICCNEKKAALPEGEVEARPAVEHVPARKAAVPEKIAPEEKEPEEEDLEIVEEMSTVEHLLRDLSEEGDEERIEEEIEEIEEILEKESAPEVRVRKPRGPRKKTVIAAPVRGRGRPRGGIGAGRKKRK
jgi:hypothetical protein